MLDFAGSQSTIGHKIFGWDLSKTKRKNKCGLVNTNEDKNLVKVYHDEFSPSFSSTLSFSNTMYLRCLARLLNKAKTGVYKINV